MKIIHPQIYFVSFFIFCLCSLIFFQTQAFAQNQGNERRTKWGLTQSDYDILDSVNLAVKAGARTRLGEMKQHARAGDQEAQMLVGIAYKDGIGVEKDEAMSEHWFKLAAENKPTNTIAMNFYASAVASRKLNAPDRPLACQWWQRAALVGDVHAMFMTGSCFRRGNFGAVNEQEALKWFQAAADAGSEEGEDEVRAHRRQIAQRNGTLPAQRPVQRSRPLTLAERSEEAQAEALAKCGSTSTNNRPSCRDIFNAVLKDGSFKYVDVPGILTLERDYRTGTLTQRAMGLTFVHRHWITDINCTRLSATSERCSYMYHNFYSQDFTPRRSYSETYIFQKIGGEWRSPQRLQRINSMRAEANQQTNKEKADEDHENRKRAYRYGQGPCANDPRAPGC